MNIAVKAPRSTPMDDSADSPLDLSLKQNDPLEEHPSNLCKKPSTEISPKPKPSMKNKVTPKRYSNSALDNILTSIRNGVITVNHASQHYGIPRGTLQYRLSSRYKNKGTTGPYTVLTNKEEQDIINFLKDMERKGFPITRNSLIHRISGFLKENTRMHPFKNNKPGKGWFRGFMNRHKDLVLCTPESVTSASAKVSEKDIRGWFQTVWTYLRENNLLSILDDPSRILNGDETGFCLNPVAKHVLASRGKNNVSVVEAGSSKQNITVMFTFCADGSVLPPDLILAQKRLSRELIQSFPREWGLGNSENGWMDTKNFVLYVKKIVHPFLLKKGVRFPVIFFVDGHKSHTAIEAAETCKRLGIILIALFPNATRILQAADVAVFKPLKNSWTNVVEIWKSSNTAAPVSLFTFGPLLQDAMKDAFKQCTIINGFAACGLCLFNPNAVDYSKCIAKNVYDRDGVSYAIPLDVTVQVENIQEKTVQKNTVQEKTVQEETVQKETIEEEPVEELHYLVPAHVIEEALEMLGPSKIQMYKDEDVEIFSPEDKAFAFIYKNILMRGAIVLDSCKQSSVPINGTPYEEETTGSGNLTTRMDIAEQYGDNAWDNTDTDSAILRSCEWMSENGIASSFLDTIHENLDDAPVAVLEVASLAEVDTDIQCLPVLDQTLGNNSQLKSNDQLVGRYDTSIKDRTHIYTKHGSSSPLDVAATATVKQELVDYLVAPPTPKRSTVHRNYQYQTHAILTAEERLQDLVLKENMKEEIAKLKKQKAAVRESKKLMLEEEKRTRKEKALKRRLGREEVQRQKQEANRIKIEAKKPKSKPMKSAEYQTVPKSALKIII